MITINSKRFARNDKEFMGSLFTPGGTCVGYYKPTKRQVVIMNMRKERIGVINPKGLLVAATKVPGGYWYSFATIPEIGEYESYAKSIEEPKEIRKRLCVNN